MQLTPHPQLAAPLGFPHNPLRVLGSWACPRGNQGTGWGATNPYMTGLPGFPRLYPGAAPLSRAGPRLNPRSDNTSQVISPGRGRAVPAHRSGPGFAFSSG